jgi:phosphopantothenoylcysteine decarboxylase/phosphopantothenate--cysteine ligase
MGLTAVLTGKRVLLIVSGGIAAYKSLELIRRLKEKGAAAAAAPPTAAQGSRDRARY